MIRDQLLGHETTPSPGLGTISFIFIQFLDTSLPNIRLPHPPLVLVTPYRNDGSDIGDQTDMGFKIKQVCFAVQDPDGNKYAFQ